MNISMKNLSGFPFSPAGMQKSAKERQQRRDNMESQVDALKAGQASLKNRECDTLESIAEKLALYHSYESEIAAVKKAYNMEEMSHVMDEATERGEKIAEAAEERRPKTKEERRKEALAEATGVEEGLLSKLTEENPLLEDASADPDADVPEDVPEDFKQLQSSIDLKEMAEQILEEGRVE